MSKVKIAFIDLDGVMNAISKVRAHLEPVHTDRSSYWSEWHKAHVKEAINQDMVYMVRGLYDAGWKIAFCSSRGDSCMDSTMAQLNAALPGVRYTVSLRNPLDDSTPAKFKEGVISALALGALMAADEVYVTAIDDSAEVITAIKAWAVKPHGVTVSTVHVHTFRG